MDHPYHSYPPAFGHLGESSFIHAPGHSPSTSNQASQNSLSVGVSDPSVQVTGGHDHPGIYYSGNSSGHPSSIDTSYIATVHPTLLSPVSLPLASHSQDAHHSTAVTAGYTPAAYHETSSQLYSSQAFGMDMSLGVGFDPSFRPGVAEGYNMTNTGEYGSCMNAGLDGVSSADDYSAYGFQSHVATYSMDGQYVEQSANYSQNTSESSQSTHQHIPAPVANASNDLLAGHMSMGYTQQVAHPQSLHPQSEYISGQAYLSTHSDEPIQQDIISRQPLPPQMSEAPPPSSSGVDCSCSSALSVESHVPSDFTVTEATDRQQADHSLVGPYAQSDTNIGSIRNPPRRQAFQGVESQRDEGRPALLRRSNTRVSISARHAAPAVQLPPPFACTPTFPTNLRMDAVDRVTTSQMAPSPAVETQVWQRNTLPARFRPPDDDWARAAQLHQARLQQQHQQQILQNISTAHAGLQYHTQALRFTSSSSLLGALDAGTPRQQHSPMPSQPAQQHPSELLRVRDPASNQQASMDQSLSSVLTPQQSVSQIPSSCGNGIPTDRGSEGESRAAHSSLGQHLVPPSTEQGDINHNQSHVPAQQLNSTRHSSGDLALEQNGDMMQEPSIPHPPIQEIVRNDVTLSSAQEHDNNQDRERGPQPEDGGVPNSATGSRSPIHIDPAQFVPRTAIPSNSLDEKPISKYFSKPPPLNRATLDMGDHIHSLARAEQRHRLVDSYYMRHGCYAPPEYHLGEEDAPSKLERGIDSELFDQAVSRQELDTSGGFVLVDRDEVEGSNEARGPFCRNPLEVLADLEAADREAAERARQNVNTNDPPLDTATRTESIADPSPIEPDEAITPVSPVHDQAAVEKKRVQALRDKAAVRILALKYPSHSYSPALNAGSCANPKKYPLHLLRHDGHISAYVSGLPGEAYDGRSYLVDDVSLANCNPRAPRGARVGDMPDVPRPHPLAKLGEEFHILMNPDKPIVPSAPFTKVLRHIKKLKLTVEKKAPPKLACHFCRARKIACGPGDGSDGTCNQCERRKLRCEFPTESRRGIRTNKGSKRKRGNAQADNAVEGGDEANENAYEDEPTENEAGPSSSKKRKRGKAVVEKSKKKQRGRGSKGKGNAGESMRSGEPDEDGEENEENAPDVDETTTRLDAEVHSFEIAVARPETHVSMDDIFIFNQDQLRRQAQTEGELPLEYFEDVPLLSSGAVQLPNQPNATSQSSTMTSQAQAFPEVPSPFATHPLQPRHPRKAKKARR